ncbi:amidase [Aestuariicoccus sp. MJ-SS9]|uniref:amidase n=1 Tax=Aestuariicoccus sp. MJ-SS9 TaxID=3079855 RepID=UPI0029125E4E|nr:amidase [Aestuariicoccus sp. MJ-SS9]MDU8911653.1 amidase [Aestuariicoccus sp. MJ-SS9]
MRQDFWTLGAADLTAAYRDGRADPVAVVEELTARIAALNPVLNAYVALAEDLPEQARASQRRWQAGKPLSPLDGVPVAIKDNLHVAGMRTAWGGHTFDTVAGADELPVARLRAAGAILVGKTNTPEFAVEGYTANARFGVTRNPWDPALTPGGSSGGSVAAVAAGLATLAIGTDGGGSTRRPAGHTGLYGLKPSIGRIARGGGLPQILLDFEVIGTFARDCADLDLLYRVLAGADRGDPASRALPAVPDSAEGLRILSVPLLGEKPCDAEILTAHRALADRLSGLGHHVSEGPLPIDLDPVGAFWGSFGQIGLAALRDRLPEMAAKAGPLYLQMAEAGAALPAPALFNAIEAVRALRSAMSQLFAQWDVILMPTAAAQPWPAEKTHPETIAGTPVGPRGHAIYTGWVNASGHPGLAVPAGFDRAGLPIGCQLIGDLGGEDRLIRLAGALERRGPGWRWPALCTASGKGVEVE